jgi:hypothetical protein
VWVHIRGVGGVGGVSERGGEGSRVKAEKSKYHPMGPLAMRLTARGLVPFVRGTIMTTTNEVTARAKVAIRGASWVGSTTCRNYVGTVHSFRHVSLARALLSCKCDRLLIVDLRCIDSVCIKNTHDHDRDEHRCTLQELPCEGLELS